MKIKFKVSLALFVILAVFLTACGGNETAPVVNAGNEPANVAVGEPMDEEVSLDEPAGEQTDGEPALGVEFYLDPLTQTGDVISAGSSTVFPLASKMADRLTNEGFGGSITIDSIGSGGGFDRFCETGETDVSNASRPIKDSEVDACAALGRTPIEFRVGTDALSVVVSTENDFVTELSLEEVALVFTAEKWSDVNPDWPEENILRYVPGTDSGTFDFFVEVIFAEDSAPLLNAPNTEFSEDDNTLVQGVLGSPYAVGFFGYAYYAENADALNIMTIEGIEPTLENVDTFTYPLARPLFIYSDAAIMQEKPQVASYILYFLTYVNEEIVEVGYFPASNNDLAGGLNAWIEAMGQ